LLSFSFNSWVSIEVVRRRLGHASTETTQSHFALRIGALDLKAMNQAVSRLMSTKRREKKPRSEPEGG
jgi:hypothetical protein